MPEPDTLNIAFASGNFIDEGASYVGLGSTLYIDTYGLISHILLVLKRKRH
ncbi:MAG: hypothetical protein R2764_22715 [Bacteroidales bacterium]